MTYWKAQKEQHLRQLAHLFEGDPGGVWELQRLVLREILYI